VIGEKNNEIYYCFSLLIIRW